MLKKDILNILECVKEAKRILSQSKLYEFGELLDESWKIKKSLDKEISSSRIDSIYSLAKKNGAIGGKILACNLTPGNFYNFPFDGICSIKNCTYEVFEKRLLYIFSISKKNYFSQLGKNRNYTVYYNKNHSTIEIVKKELDLLLN